jgi:hypothetical protein
MMGGAGRFGTNFGDILARQASAEVQKIEIDY